MQSNERNPKNQIPMNPETKPPTLVEKALQNQGPPRHIRTLDSEKLELALAVLNNKVSPSAAMKVLGEKRTNYYSWIFSILRQALALGLIRIERKAL